MLGYLEAKHWADAIKTHGFDKENVFGLMKHIEEEYNIDLKSEVEEIFLEDNRKEWEHDMTILAEKKIGKEMIVILKKDSKYYLHRYWLSKKGWNISVDIDGSNLNSILRYLLDKIKI